MLLYFSNVHILNGEAMADITDTFIYDVFLSHNQADKPQVRRLAERLRSAGVRVWLDEWVYKGG
jgi:hypothetical protein